MPHREIVLKSKKSKPPPDVVQWLLSAASIIPIIVGIMGVRSQTGPPDQHVGAVMTFGFFFVPLSFLIALGSANRARKNWYELNVTDRFIGLGPLAILLFLALLAVLMVTFTDPSPRRRAAPDVPQANQKP